ncbi:hypothetical protein GQ457_13G002900 [Hibiscus cannabinus]
MEHCNKPGAGSSSRKIDACRNRRQCFFQSSFLVERYHKDNQNSAKESFQDHYHFGPFTTKFPESRSCATGSSAAFLDVLEDQTTALVLFVIERTPVSLILRTPEASETEASLLATHTTVPVDTFLYQIPRYLKNPISKVPLVDTRVSPSLMDCSGVVVVKK